MNAFRNFAALHPVFFVLLLAVAWLFLLIAVMVIASGIIRKPYGDPVANTIGRLVMTACVTLIIWKLGWLDEAGVTPLGSLQVWLLALGALIYFSSASLYSLYGKVAIDLPGIYRHPDTRGVLTTLMIGGFSEEILFRGLILYALFRVWGNTALGMVGSVLLTSLLFAVLHITQVFTNGVSPASALFLTFQTMFFSFWWGALVIIGGSLWPVVVLHVGINTIVALQGLIVPMMKPDVVAYQRLLYFSIPLGLLGLILLLRPAQHRIIFPDVH